ncbi:MAG: hypothetical protein R3D99_06580 [Altererythrobacter sp.]
MRAIVAAVLVLVPPTAWAQSNQGAVSITIYDQQALVEDTRVLALPTGEVHHEFREVSAAIRPETVSLEGDAIEIAEQNFDFDLLSPASLMRAAEGESITLIRRNPATGAETTEQARVLAVNGGVVIEVGGKVEVLRDDGQPVRVVFDDIPENLRASPTLSVTFDPERAGFAPAAAELPYFGPWLECGLCRRVRRGTANDGPAGLGHADQHYRNGLSERRTDAGCRRCREAQPACGAAQPQQQLQSRQRLPRRDRAERGG